jgi:hypothetical protein
MPYLKNNNAFFLNFLRFFIAILAKATQFICLSFTNYIKLKYKINTKKMKNEIKNVFRIFYTYIFY